MKSLLLSAVVALFVVLPLSAQNLDWAEPQTPSSFAPEDGSAYSAGPTLPSDPTPVPIDGGLLLLAAAGGAYAARRLRQRARNTIS